MVYAENVIVTFPNVTIKPWFELLPENIELCTWLTSIFYFIL